MFEPTTLFMIFMMLCFAGMAAMFYFILRGLDELSRELRGERSQLVGLMQSMEASLDLLVKSAQISLKRQAAQDQAGKETGGNGSVAKDQAVREEVAFSTTAAPAEQSVGMFTAGSTSAAAKLEKELTALQIKSPAKLKMDMNDGKGPLSLRLDDTK